MMIHDRRPQHRYVLKHPQALASMTVAMIMGDARHLGTMPARGPSPWLRSVASFLALGDAEVAVNLSSLTDVQRWPR